MGEVLQRDDVRAEGKRKERVGEEGEKGVMEEEGRVREKTGKFVKEGVQAAGEESMKLLRNRLEDGLEDWRMGKGTWEGEVDQGKGMEK